MSQIYIFFSFFHIGYYRYWVDFPGTHSGSLPAICSICAHPIFPVYPLPTPPLGFPFGTYKLDFKICEFVSVLYILLYLFNQLNGIIWYCVWLTSLIIMISGSIRVAAHGIISSFYGWIIVHCVYIYMYIYICILSSLFIALSMEI